MFQHAATDLPTIVLINIHEINFLPPPRAVQITRVVFFYLTICCHVQVEQRPPEIRTERTEFASCAGLSLEVVMIFSEKLFCLTIDIA